MSDIQRYSGFDCDFFKRSKEGVFVKHEDHIKAIEDKDMELKKTKAMVDVASESAKRRGKTIESQAKKIDMIKKALDVLANKCLNQDNNFAESLALKSFANHVKELTK